MTHSTAWEDGGIVAVLCDGKATDMLLDAQQQERQPRECPICKKQLRLVWDVRIEEYDPSVIEYASPPPPMPIARGRLTMKRDKP